MKHWHVHVSSFGASQRNSYFTDDFLQILNLLGNLDLQTLHRVVIQQPVFPAGRCEHGSWINLDEDKNEADRDIDQ